MKNIALSLLFLLALGLSGLVVWQWQREARLRAAWQQQGALLGSLQSTQQQLLALQQGAAKVAATHEAELARRAAEVKSYQAALAQANATITNQNARLQQLVADHNAVTARYNQLAADYNAALAQLNALKEKRTPPPAQP